MTQTKYTAPKTLPKETMHSGEERTFAKDGGVCLRVVPGRGKYVSGAKHNVPVLVELHSGEKIQEKGTEKEERKPLHLCLVLDKSGSMSGKKLAFAKVIFLFLFFFILFLIFYFIFLYFHRKHVNML